MLNAGRLDRRITIQSPVTTQDAYGAEVVTFQTLRDVFARVAPVRGKEAFDGSAILAEADTKIEIRAAPDLQAMNEKWRALYRGKAYNFYSVAESGMGREFIEIMAKSGVNAG